MILINVNECLRQEWMNECLRQEWVNECLRQEWWMMMRKSRRVGLEPGAQESIPHVNLTVAWYEKGSTWESDDHEIRNRASMVEGVNETGRVSRSWLEDLGLY